MAKKSGLGRGLDALFDENSTDEASVSELKLSEIEPNAGQPRKEFDNEALIALSESILEHGVIQPLTVRPLANGRYQLVAGERRWRASRMAGLKSVPVVIKQLTDREVMEIALVENLQREDLTPLEEAEGYKALSEQFELTQEEVAKKVGKSRPAVANAMRLLLLPEKCRKALANGEITAGHARAMLSLDPDELDNALKLAKKGATVREIEKLSQKKPKKVAKPRPVNKFAAEVEASLCESMGRSIKVKPKNSKSDSGKIEIEYFSAEDLAKIANLLGKED